jgi:hypothetical protein
MKLAAQSEMLLELESLPVVQCQGLTNLLGLRLKRVATSLPLLVKLHLVS